jgi:hypothetical protein
MKSSAVHTQLAGRGLALVAIIIALAGWVSGCGKGPEEAALDSDANGYLCLGCQSKFYTDRRVFANHCPACQKPQIEMVVGFVCPVDHYVTYGPRGRGSLKCGQCGKFTSGLSIPREPELKTWGAAHKTAAEVGSP